MSLCDQARLGLRHPGVGQITPSPLIDGIMYRTQKRIRCLPGIPAQGGPVYLHKSGLLIERSERQGPGVLQGQTGYRGLAHTRRTVQKHMLREGRGYLGDQSLNRALLTYDLIDRSGPQYLRGRAGQVPAIQLLELGILAQSLSVVRTAFLSQDLHPQLPEIILVTHLHLNSHFSLERVFHAAPGHHLGQLFLDGIQHLEDVAVPAQLVYGRILEDYALQTQDTLIDIP